MTGYTCITLRSHLRLQFYGFVKNKSYCAIYLVSGKLFPRLLKINSTLMQSEYKILSQNITSMRYFGYVQCMCSIFFTYDICNFIDNIEGVIVYFPKSISTGFLATFNLECVFAGKFTSLNQKCQSTIVFRCQIFRSSKTFYLRPLV